MPKLRVELWTDGSGTTSGPIGWAYVLRAVDENGVLRSERVSAGGEQEGTNNRAELTAVIEGFRALRRPCDVTLVSDSEYVLKGLTEWAPAWQRNGWRRADGGSVKNVDLWHLLLGLVGGHEVTPRHVEGHTGIELNERCDRLAGCMRRAIKEEIEGSEEE